MTIKEMIIDITATFGRTSEVTINFREYINSGANYKAIYSYYISIYNMYNIREW